VAGDVTEDAVPGAARRRFDIVVPVYNEEACVDEFCARMARLGYLDAVLFVDNASTDGTVSRLQQYSGIRLIRHATNEGYGASIRDAIAASQAELIVVIDADLEYPPERIAAILQALESHTVVYGSRFLGEQPPDMPLFRRAGNRLISAIYNRLFRQHTTDLYTGMKGLRRAALPLAQLQQNGFEHVVELGALIAAAGAQIHDVPVEYTPRSRGHSKMRHVPETMKFAAYLCGYWLRDIVWRRRSGSP
jgi:glycosyltransferase involved in cell wall biosynthesis